MNNLILLLENQVTYKIKNCRKTFNFFLLASFLGLVITVYIGFSFGLQATFSSIFFTVVMIVAAILQWTYKKQWEEYLKKLKQLKTKNGVIQ